MLLVLPFSSNLLLSTWDCFSFRGAMFLFNLLKCRLNSFIRVEFILKAILTNLFDMKKSLEKEAKKKKKTKLKMPWLYFQIYYFLFPNLKTYYSLDVKLLPVTHENYFAVITSDTWLLTSSLASTYSPSKRYRKIPSHLCVKNKQ